MKSAHTRVAIALLTYFGYFGCCAAPSCAKPLTIYVADFDTNISGESRAVAKQLTEAIDTAFTRRSADFRVLERRKINDVIRANKLESDLRKFAGGGDASQKLRTQLPEIDAIVTGTLQETRLEGVILTIALTRINSEKPWQQQRSHSLLEWLAAKVRNEESVWLAADAASSLLPRVVASSVAPPSDDGPLGIAKAQAGDCESASPLLTNAAALDGTNPEVLFWLGHCEMLGGELPAAAQRLGAAIRLNRNNAGYFAERARVYAQQRQYDLALNDLDQAVERDRDNPDVIELRGDVWMKTGKYNAAVEAFATVLDRRPSKAICGKLVDSYRRNGARAAAEKTQLVCDGM